MALGRKDVTVTGTNRSADIFRLARLFGDDNLIRHQGVRLWTGFDPERIVNSPAHRKSPSGRFASGAAKPRRNANRVVRRAGAVVKAACSISANPYYSVQRFYRVSEAKDAPDRALPSLRFGHQERLHPVLKSQWFRPLIRPDFSLRSILRILMIWRMIFGSKPLPLASA